MAEDTKQLETLSYKPNKEDIHIHTNSYSMYCVKHREFHSFGQSCLKCVANSPPANMGLNSAVIEPETKVENSEDVSQHLEQPNLMIIEEIEGLISQVNDRLYKLNVDNLNIKEPEAPLKRMQALEEIDLFQKTTLFELRKVFE